MILRDWLRITEQSFAEVGVDAPDFDARALASHVLGVSLTDVQMSGDRELAASEFELLTELSARRATREPLQYIVGDTEFYGRAFLCDPRALIPRPDTETLVEVALELARNTGARDIVDVGTGTGALAITLALELPDARVLATDLSPDALALAEANVQAHGLAERVELAQGDLLAPALEPDRSERVQMVVSNPPYVRPDEWNGLQAEIVAHEPRTALVGEGVDGLGCYARMLADCADLPKLRAVAFEVGAEQAAGVTRLMNMALPGCATTVHEDLGGIQRVVAATPGGANS